MRVVARMSAPPPTSARPRREPDPTSSPAPEREPRGARRKRETREKLLRAAFRLIAEKGVDAVAINEITEAADVGFGSFYNHFASKEAIHEAVFQAVFEAFGDALEQLTRDVEDPAEVIAVCVRHTILRARKEHLWGRFFLHEGFTARAMTRGLAARLLRDIHNGIAQRRFDTLDPPMALAMAGGTVMATVAAEAAVAEAGATAAEQLGFDTKDLATRAAAVILRGLGLRRDEATRIAARPLPVFESPPAFA